MSLPEILENEGSVPVYDCHVILAPSEDGGGYVARSATLSGVTATAGTERDVLRKMVDAFKQRLIAHRNAGEPIPWLEPADTPQPGELERWIPVHL